MPLSPGEKLGPYEIVSAIGAGGMGEVYKARDTRLDRAVAIKVLPEHIAKREDLRQRFEREARAVASLNHPLNPGGMAEHHVFPLDANGRGPVCQTPGGTIYEGNSHCRNAARTRGRLACSFSGHPGKSGGAISSASSTPSAANSNAVLFLYSTNFKCSRQMY